MSAELSSGGVARLAGTDVRIPDTGRLAVAPLTVGSLGPPETNLMLMIGPAFSRVADECATTVCPLWSMDRPLGGDLDENFASGRCEQGSSRRGPSKTSGSAAQSPQTSSSIVPIDEVIYATRAMMIIRPALVLDAPAMASVHVDSWRAAYLGLVPAVVLNGLSVATRTASWTRTLADGEARGSRAWVAVLDGRIVGFVSAGPTRDADDHRGQVGEIYAIYLAPTAWGRGLGGELLRVAEDDLSERGYRTATIWVLAGNTRARRFYAQCGYDADGGAQNETVGPAVLPSVRYRRSL
jgi:GNAT superfamily N-acetyltransferase